MRSGEIPVSIGLVPKTVLKVLAASVVAWLLLVAAIAAGLRVPGITYPPGFPPARALDATRPTSGYVPLAQRYIDQILGSPGGQPATGNVDAVAPAQDAGAPASVGSTATSAIGERAGVNHPFTNDDFGRAQIIPQVPFTARTSMRGATREPGEPISCAPVGGTAWYRYVGPAGGGLFADTFGSHIALALGVFEGTALSSLKPVGCNTSATGNAQVGFTAQAHHVYYLQITATAGGGDLVVDLAPVGMTTPASVPTGTRTPDGPGYAAAEVAMTPNGRYLAFKSYSPLDPHHPAPPGSCAGSDAFFCGEVYVRDRVTQTTELVSLSTTGQAANGDSGAPSISADGRYVAFSSFATNLVPGDTNGVPDVFVHDRLTGVTTRESVNARGQQLESPTPGLLSGLGSFGPHLSADGQYLAFSSDAVNLVPRPPCPTGNSCPLAFLRDRLTGSTRLASTDGHGKPPSDATDSATADGISASGRYVVFDGGGDNWGGGSCHPDTNSSCGLQLYRWDRRTGRTLLITRGLHGAPSNAGPDPESVAVSRDGRLISFQSPASNLVRRDTNGLQDAFVWSAAGAVARVSVTSDGAQQLNPQSAESDTTYPVQTGSFTAVSADGRYVAFDSRARNLVPGDTNNASDVFVHDRLTGATIRVSVSSTGAEGNGASWRPAISASGDVVVFLSQATNFGGKGVEERLYVHLRSTGGI